MNISGPGQEHTRENNINSSMFTPYHTKTCVKQNTRQQNASNKKMLSPPQSDCLFPRGAMRTESLHIKIMAKHTRSNICAHVFPAYYSNIEITEITFENIFL